MGGAHRLQGKTAQRYKVAEITRLESLLFLDRNMFISDTLAVLLHSLAPI